MSMTNTRCSRGLRANHIDVVFFIVCSDSFPVVIVRYMCASVLIYTDCVDARVFFVVYIINAHFVYARAFFCYCVWKRGDHNRNTLAQHTHKNA